MCVCVFVFASGHVICEGGSERGVRCVSERAFRPRPRVSARFFFKRVSRDADILARDEWEEGWMRLARVWRGLSRCKLEKFPYGSKMSATLLIEFLMRARCRRRGLTCTRRTVSSCLCAVFMCVCF